MNTSTDQLIREANPPQSSDQWIWLPGTNRRFRSSMNCIGGFMSTCAMMHALRVTSQIESLPTPKRLLTRIPEMRNIEERQMRMLKRNSYIYTPLPIESSQRAIRLIAILPSKQKTADIECILGPESLNQDPSYEALSYTWGDATKLKHIDVCGRAFYVTENLEIALRNLRLWNRPRVLWIDAICINQNDVVEKSSQVRQMGEIYSQAREVLIWLGPETNSSAKAFYFLRSIIYPSINKKFLQHSCGSGMEIKSDDCQPIISSEFSDRNFSFSPTYEDEQRKKKLLQFTVQQDPNSIQYLQAICELLHRPWWKRIWVIQELVRSKSAKLVCGTQTFPWTEFYHALGTVVNAWPNRNTSVIQQSRITAVRDMKTTVNARIELLQDIATSFVPAMAMQYLRERWLSCSETTLSLMIFVTRRFASTDPRDKIYALLGLINNNRDLGDIAIPDYDISPSALFAKVAKWIICHRQDLALFEELQNVKCPPSGQVEGFSLPSWVPDFGFDHSIPAFDGNFWAFEENEDIMGRCSIYLALNLAKENFSGNFTRPFEAGLEKTSPVPFQFSSDGKILTVIGVEVDIVLNVFEPCLYDIGACVNGWKQNILPDGDSTAVYKRGGTIKEAFWRTILANINLWHCDVLEFPQLIKDRIYGVSKMPPRSADDEKKIETAMLMGTRIPLPAFRRRIFQTSSGLLGLGPASMEAGDIVTVLYGSRMCVVLRPSRASEQYQVIGQSYVHGIMDGEIILEQRQGRCVLRGFDLY